MENGDIFYWQFSKLSTIDVLSNLNIICYYIVDIPFLNDLMVATNVHVFEDCGSNKNTVCSVKYVHKNQLYQIQIESPRRELITHKVSAFFLHCQYGKKTKLRRINQIHW